MCLFTSLFSCIGKSLQRARKRYNWTKTNWPSLASIHFRPLILSVEDEEKKCVAIVWTNGQQIILFFHLNDNLFYRFALHTVFTVVSLPLIVFSLLELTTLLVQFGCAGMSPSPARRCVCVCVCTLVNDFHVSITALRCINRTQLGISVSASLVHIWPSIRCALQLLLLRHRRRSRWCCCRRRRSVRLYFDRVGSHFTNNCTQPTWISFALVSLIHRRQYRHFFISWAHSSSYVYMCLFI